MTVISDVALNVGRGGTWTPIHWAPTSSWLRRPAGPTAPDLGLSGFPRLPFPPPMTAPWAERNDDWEISLGLRGGSNRNNPPDRLLKDA